MLPGRLGLRFALEALFLVLLAIGAGLADLRPALIVLVMAVAWVLVAVAEYTAERISASPLSSLLPRRPDPAEGGEELPVSWPMPEERTIVAPPEQPAEPEDVSDEPEPAADEEPPVESREDEPEAPPRRRRLSSLLRRRERDDDPAPATPPRHVKLLPRRSAPQESRAAQEVAELFGSADSHAGEREERGG